MRPLTLMLTAALAVSTVALAATPAAAAGPHLVVGRAVAPAGLLSGPDVSSHQGDHGLIGWGSVAASGHAFAVVKATEGTGYVNPYFARDWAQAAAQGIVRSAYAFARPSRSAGSAAAQATKLVRTVGSLGGGATLPLVLDMEESGGLSPVQLQAWTRSFLTTVERLTGRTPFIYTYGYFWQHQMGGATDFTRYPLWIGSLTRTAPTRLPGGWTHWTLWQYSDTGRVPGIKGAVDLSVFCCSAAALRQLAGGTPTSTTAAPDAIAQRYAALGGSTGVLGAPTSPEITFGAGRFRDYVYGSIYWTAATGAHLLTGATLARYRGNGGPASVLGWPTSDTLPTESGPVGTYAVFQGGRLYAGPGDPVAWRVTGTVLGSWLQQSSIAGPLGLPTADVASVTGGTRGTFAGGQVLSSPTRGTHTLTGPLLAAWLAAGGPDSAYGLPSSDPVQLDGRQLVQFGQFTLSVVG